MSQLNFSSIDKSRDPFHYNIKRINDYYSTDHPERLNSMIERYNKAERQRAYNAQKAMLRRMQDPDFVRSWGTKNKPDVAISSEEALQGYTKYMKEQPIKRSEPRGEFPDSYKTRKEKRTAKKTALLDQLKQVYPPNSSDKDLMIYYKQGREQYNKMRGYEKRKLTDQEKAERVNRSMIHMTRPAAVIKYADRVQAYDGEDYPDEERITGFKAGDYPQFDPKIRDKATKMFAELTGTLGIMPTYDPKLATYESARRIYPEEDYDIRLYDMDGDDLTPATLIIKKKYEIDKNGEYQLLPKEDWKIVAVNGYRLPNPSEASNIRRLKDMDYYKNHPTSQSRQKEPFSEYVKKAYNKTNTKALTVLKDIIRLYINTYYPDHSYMQLLYRGAPSSKVYFTVSPVVLNTIIARAARIWAMYIYAYADPEDFDGTKDLSREAEIFHDYLTDIQAEGINTTMESSLYKKYLMEPAVENFILRHKGILELLKDEADTLIKMPQPSQHEKRNDIFKFVNLAIRGFININDKVVSMALNNDITKEISHYTFRFIPNPLPDAIEIATVPFSDKRGAHGEPSALEDKRGIQYWGAKYLPAAPAARLAPAPRAPSFSLGSGNRSHSPPPDSESDDDDDEWGENAVRGSSSSSSSSDSSPAAAAAAQ